ncbi:unnamed protein product [Meloidogyne enterolobii]|uniref:Uncharacterized protein n=1 Tax=Meloidogyne enterolobii TaxID=390850 RepID=A0ACB0ZYW4_MELEN
MIENKGASETDVVDTSVVQNDVNQVNEDSALVKTDFKESDSNEGTPVRTEDDGKPRFFSLAQITVKVNDFASAAIASVKEKFLGEDYWIPRLFLIIKFYLKYMCLVRALIPSLVDLFFESKIQLAVTITFNDHF